MHQSDHRANWRFSLTTTTLVLFISCVSLSPLHAKTESNSPNRLIHEKSPYLLQHAYNPVDWYPWGEEAFNRAAQEDKPIFLSIGYSTCHWCHVMERESFEDHAVAKQLNDAFISIKVDREERPDIDKVYMDIVQKMTGNGGWPLTVFLTPDKKPFFGGTYFPPQTRHNRPSFSSLLTSIKTQWGENRQRLLDAGQTVVRDLQERETKSALQSSTLDTSTLDQAYATLAKRYDERFGGFGNAPKFPRPHNYLFLMRYWKRTGDDEALDIVIHSLTKMAKGGIYDQLGGGFHRYSTDRRWFLPHFEKMIYDQALITNAYLEAFQITGKPLFAKIARETLDYVLRQMTDPQGGFYSAEDADSALSTDEPDHKKEGAFYLWDSKDVHKMLERENAEIFSYYYGLKINGNIEHDPHQEFGNGNVLSIPKTPSEAAKPFGISGNELTSKIDELKPLLLEARSKKIRPSLDDKVLTDWASLMISTFAKAYIILGDEQYLSTAKRAMNFLLDKMKTSDNRLLHRYRTGDASIHGFLDDHAFLLVALLDLYEASFQPEYLQEAVEIANQMISLFWDDVHHGGFYLSAHDAEKILVRTKKLYDGAIPSGNSMALLGLIRLYRITSEPDYDQYAFDSFAYFSQRISKNPTRYTQLLCALDFYLGPSREIVIAGDPKSEDTEAMLSELNHRYLPSKVVLLHPSKGKNRKKIEALAPFIKNQLQIKGKATAYICRDHICKLPTTDVDRFATMLEENIHHA